MYLRASSGRRRQAITFGADGAQRIGPLKASRRFSTAGGQGHEGHDDHRGYTGEPPVDCGGRKTQRDIRRLGAIPREFVTLQL